ELIDSDIDDVLAEIEPTPQPEVAEAILEPESDAAEFDEESPSIETVVDQDEAPEISIDELFDGENTPIVTPDIISDEDEDINEDVLQKLDKEIAEQNAEIDNITGNLLDELEQVEQMREMLGDFGDDDDEDEAPQNTVAQPSIQKLDEESLAAGFDENAGFEPEFLEIDNELDENPEDDFGLALSAEAEESAEIGQQADIKETADADFEEQAEIEEQADIEETADIEEQAEIEEMAEVEE
ncbi:MAG: pilus assembly protein FimV, partial [Paraglaciecola sp.]|nr:pilus assembly protein FimV [Paraglaciecola sp.]